MCIYSIVVAISGMTYIQLAERVARVLEEKLSSAFHHLALLRFELRARHRLCREPAENLHHIRVGVHTVQYE